MDRRRLLEGGAALAAGRALPAPASPASPVLSRPIPRTGERLPAIGMGTWLTFDVWQAGPARATRREVLRELLAGGGRVIDSSPMYGRAEEVVGGLLGELAGRASVFSATKVWTIGQATGQRELQRSLGYWGLKRFDLVQIHNMLDWQTHLPWLRAWKAEGRIRHLGITTSHGRRHEELEQALRRESFDFVQFTYSLADRSVEQRLLPLAADRGVAVIANRPFDGGDLFSRVRGKALPAWAAEAGCANWPQFFLKFVVSHPAVTCAIPATTRPEHMAENATAALGTQPDAQQRRRMAGWFDAI